MCPLTVLVEEIVCFFFWCQDLTFTPIVFPAWKLRAVCNERKSPDDGPGPPPLIPNDVAGRNIALPLKIQGSIFDPPSCARKLGKLMQDRRIGYAVGKFRPIDLKELAGHKSRLRHLRLKPIALGDGINDIASCLIIEFF